MTPVPAFRSFRLKPRAGAGVTALFLGMLALSGMSAALVGHADRGAGQGASAAMADLGSPAQESVSARN